VKIHSIVYKKVVTIVKKRPYAEKKANGAKYTNKQIKQLRKFATILSVPEAAKMVGINKWSAYQIVRGGTWCHLPILKHINQTGRR
jgi:hypothetical protein